MRIDGDVFVKTVKVAPVSLLTMRALTVKITSLCQPLRVAAVDFGQFFSDSVHLLRL